MKILLLSPLLAIALSGCASNAASTATAASASAASETKVSAAGLRKQEPGIAVFSVAEQTAPTPALAPHKVINVMSTHGLNCRVPAPSYPVHARAAHEEGTVWVRMRLSEDGKLTDATVTRSSGYAALDDAAMRAIVQIQCLAPGYAVTLTQPFAFKLGPRVGAKRGPGAIPAPSAPAPATPPA
jgi:protein TonB